MTKTEECTTERERMVRYEKALVQYVGVHRKMAVQRQRWYDRQREVYFNRGKTGKGIVVGSEVLRFEGMRRLKQNKLQPYFSGPWKVVVMRGNACDVELVSDAERFDRINKKWLKVYQRRQPLT